MKRHQFATTAIFCCLLFTSLFSQSSQLINYQGKLTEKDGAIKSSNYKITFSIYSDATSATALWEETQVVNVQNGVFNILLGSYKPFPTTLFVGSGNRFLGIKVEDDPEMNPRFQLTSVPYSIQPAIPSGVVVMWSGTIETIPYGWALCDGKEYPRSDGAGTIKTPDLRERFVVGAGSDNYPVASNGGTEKVVPAGSIALSGNVGGVTLSEAQLPSHKHALGIYEQNDEGYDCALYDYAGKITDNGPMIAHAANRKCWNPYSQSIGGGQPHNHPFNGTAIFAGNDEENRPPFYALAFIMKL